MCDPRDEQQRIGWIAGSCHSIALSGAMTDGRLTVLRSEPSGETAAPVHVHPEEGRDVVLSLGYRLGMEQFFQSAGWYLSSTPAPDDWAVDMVALHAATAQFGQTILGPRPADTGPDAAAPYPLAQRLEDAPNFDETNALVVTAASRATYVVG